MFRDAVWVSLGVCILMLLLCERTVCAQVRDLQQCQRRCEAVYGVGSEGRRPLLDRGMCLCLRETSSLGTIPRRNPPWETEPIRGICAADGHSYASPEFLPPETPAVHGGPCGACSNAQDVRLLYETRFTLTETATRCAQRYVLMGRDAAKRCFQSVGFTPACEECWLDNMGCTFVHCGGTCIKSRLLREPNTPGGTLNACLACDERYCGEGFLRCSGATRRRMGITSDISRPDTQRWKGTSAAPEVTP